MMQHLRNFFLGRVRSFGYAFAGWGHILRSQCNAWIHTLASLLVILLGSILHVTRLEWALLVFAMGLVWMSEAFNTALETLADLTHPAPHPLMKIAKDAGAAAVLIAALSAAVIGALVFLPYLFP